jgi:hypothetical protein
MICYGLPEEDFVRLAAIVKVMLAVLVTAPGCDRGGTSSAPATQPIAGQTTALPAPPATQAAAAYIWVNDRMYEFPPARVILRHKDERLIALLFSDDPPNAIDDNYAGNSFYLELSELETPESGKLDGATWSYKAPNSERAESVSGIFLHGRRSHLQPFDVRIQFEGADSPVTARIIASTFLQFDSTEVRTPGKLVTVRAELSADVKERGQK